MNPKSPAHRAYSVRLGVSMAIYVVVLLLVVWVFNNRPPQGPVRYLLAVAPAIPLLGVIWGMGRYLLEEQDEYLRFRTARAMILAMGLTLALATVWGFVENFAGGPRIPLYYVFVVFSCMLGLTRYLP